MRITEEDVLKSVIFILKNNGFNVVADDVEEGYKEPAIFVGCYPAEIERLCGNLERVTDYLSMEYHPAIKTRVQCMRAANQLRNAFMYNYLEVGDRVFTVEDIAFDVDSKECVLSCEFEIVYEQPMPDNEVYEETETLEIGGI